MKEASHIYLSLSGADKFAELKDRNLSSHVYSREESEEIFRRIRNQYLSAMEKLEKTLAKRRGA